MQEKVARTYQIEKQTIERIAEYANQVNCYPSDLVCLLLERGLNELESGKWQLKREVVKYRIQW